MPGLRGAAQHWHVRRRNDAIADQLIAVADDLGRQRGPGASVVIVVGRSEHGYHHILGSVPQALQRHNHHPVIVIPDIVSGLKAGHSFPHPGRVDQSP